MRIEPHENLMVLSIRHDVFGPGRLAAIAPGRVRVVEVHHHGPGIQGVSGVPGVHVRVVDQTVQAAPADCPPCDHGAFPGFGTDPPGSSEASVPPVPVIGQSEPSAPATATSPPPAFVVGGIGFIHGQTVPGVGSLLDIMA